MFFSSTEPYSPGDMLMSGSSVDGNSSSSDSDMDLDENSGRGCIVSVTRAVNLAHRPWLRAVARC